MKNREKSHSPLKLALALAGSGLISQLFTSSTVQATTIVVEKNKLSENITNRKTTLVKRLENSDNSGKNKELHVNSKIKVPKTRKYTVKLGDTVSEIAYKYNLKTTDVLEWNNLNWGSIIYVGQQLNLLQPPDLSLNPNVISENKNARSTKDKSQATKIVDLAIKYAQLGIPYVWGGTTTEGFDCSGLVQNIFNNCGINLGRTTTEQENYVTTSEIVDVSDVVKMANPGDLLFWGNHGNTYHVAIYIGNGQFVAASHPGSNIRIENVSNYFKPSFIGKPKDFT